MRSLLISLIMVLGIQVAGAQEAVTLVTGDAFAPLMWNDNGTPRGVAIEIGKAILEKAGYKVTVQSLPWSRCQELAENNGAFIPGFSKTDERLKKFLYSEITMYDEVVIVTKKGKEFPFNKPEDLKGKKIGHARGSSFGPEFEELKKSFTAEVDDGDTLRLKKILAGRIDGGIFSLGSAGVSYVVKMAGHSMDEFTVLPRVIAKDPNFIATGMKTKDAAKKIEKINAAIKALQQDGTIEKITKMTF